MSVTMTVLAPLLALSLLAALPQDSPQEPSAADVLQRARARLVGNEDPARPKSAGVLRVTGTMQVQQMPVKGTFVNVHHPDGRARMAWSFPGFGDTVEGSNGGVLYETSAMGTDVRKGWRAAAAYRMLALPRCVPWQALYSDARLDGTALVAGERCDRVVMSLRTPAELGLADPDEDCGASPGPDVWFVGRSSNLVHRIDLQVSVPNRGGGTLSLGFEDYRVLGEVLFPYRTSRTMHGFGMVAIVEGVEVGPDLPDEAFALPEAVQKAVGAPALRDAALPDPKWHVVTLEERPTAVVRATCTAEELSRTLAGVLPEVGRYLREVGAEAAGPPFTRYLAYGEGTLEIEAGIPVERPIAARGRILAGTLPGGRAATGDHIGEYHRLGESHASLQAWIAARGEVASGSPWEVYWTDPGVEPDPRKWRTQVVQPLAPKEGD